jgi:hypothetical protein
MPSEVGARLASRGRATTGRAARWLPGSRQQPRPVADRRVRSTALLFSRRGYRIDSLDPPREGEDPVTRFIPARPLRAGFLLVAAFAAAAFLLVTPAVGAPPQAACDARTNNTYQKLLECVTLEGVREHQAALQAIADANGGTRAAATPGYDASVDYVAETLEAAGWTVEFHQFDFTVAEPIRQLTPVVATHEAGGVTGDPCRHQPDSSAGEYERLRRGIHGGRGRGTAHG